MYIIMKIVISAIIIGVITEVARRYPTYGGIIAALPLVSLLSIIWMYFQGEQTVDLSKFALGVLIGFPATAMMLLIVYLSLKHAIPLFLSIGIGIMGWAVFLFAQNFILKIFKILVGMAISFLKYRLH